MQAHAVIEPDCERATHMHALGRPSCECSSSMDLSVAGEDASRRRDKTEQQEEGVDPREGRAARARLSDDRHTGKGVTSSGFGMGWGESWVSRSLVADLQAAWAHASVHTRHNAGRGAAAGNRSGGGGGL
eukprot:5445290-Prymnesium_polylepis.2